MLYNVPKVTELESVQSWIQSQELFLQNFHYYVFHCTDHYGFWPVLVIGLCVLGSILFPLLLFCFRELQSQAPLPSGFGVGSASGQY